MHNTTRAPRRRLVAFVIAAGVLVVGAACGGSSSSSKSAKSNGSTTTSAASNTAALDVQIRSWFAADDTNHDGRISQTERDAVVTADFHQMDLNQDGAVSMDDVNLDVTNMKAGPKPTGTINDQIPADADNNGRIDLAEYKAFVDKQAAAMDINKDGFYSVEEVLQFDHVGQSKTPAVTTTTAGVLGTGSSLLIFGALGALVFALSRRPRVVVPLLLAAAVVVAPFFEATASASAVYNSTGHGNSYGITFICGTFCNNQWTIPDTQSRSRPGKSGVYTVTDPVAGCETDHQGSVTDHGYSVLGSTGANASDLKWDDYNNDNTRTGGVDPIQLGPYKPGPGVYTFC